MLIRRLRESASLLTTANPSTRALAIDMIHASDIFKWNKLQIQEEKLDTK